MVEGYGMNSQNQDVGNELVAGDPEGNVAKLQKMADALTQIAASNDIDEIHQLAQAALIPTAEAAPGAEAGLKEKLMATPGGEI